MWIFILCEIGSTFQILYLVTELRVNDIGSDRLTYWEFWKHPEKPEAESICGGVSQVNAYTAYGTNNLNWFGLQSMNDKWWRKKTSNYFLTI